MNIVSVLNNINSPKVTPIGSGKPSSISELWGTLVEPLLPKKEVVLEWHRVLKDYAGRPDAVFPVRGYNSAPRGEYGQLRRGFLTHTDAGYSFFYTDNFHAAYYLKMVQDGYVPSADELLSAYKARKFPARFGPDTQEERDLMAMPRGKDPGFQVAGYLIAHIFEAGKEYFEDGCPLSLRRHILDQYFPRGERSDWKLCTDHIDQHYLRELAVPAGARKYMEAAFLRFVHPFNYFLMPKRTHCTEDISGCPELINYAKAKFRERYGAAYDEYVSMVMPETTEIEPLQDEPLSGYAYGMGIRQVGQPVVLESDETSQFAADAQEDVDDNYPGMKVGQLACKVLAHRLLQLSAAEAERFTDREYSRRVFGLSFPLLSRNRVVDADGRHRYYAAPLYIAGKTYYLCSQWYVQHRPAILRWLGAEEEDTEQVVAQPVQPISPAPSRQPAPAPVAGNGFEGMSVGQIARTVLRDKLREMSLEEAEIFTRLDHSRNVFHLSFPLLSRNRLPDAGGQYRYYASPVYIQGKCFYVTSQWYAHQRPALVHWVLTH